MGADAGGAFEAVTEGRRGTEPDLGADAFDGVRGGLQQVLGLAHPGAVQPLERSGAGLFAEPADQGAGAHIGAGGDVGQREIAGQVVLQPGEQGFEGGSAGRGRMRLDDELRLASLPFERHDGQPGGVGGDRGAVVAADQMQTQVQSGGGTGGGEDLPVVDVEDVRVDVDVRVGGGQQLGRDPVGGGAQPVEQSGGGQREGAGADGGEAGAGGGGRVQRVVDGGREGRRRVGGSGDDDGVRARQTVQPPWRTQLEWSASTSGRSAQTRTW